ncbi:MAG: hypothetical protein V1861_02590 [Candidatus Micrarchaeota archaeon]
MRGANIFVILLVVGILLFGCTTPTPPTKPNGTGTPPATGGQTTPPDGTGGNGSSDTEPPEDDDTGSGSSGDDLAGKGYEALAALGIPLQCDISTTYNGTTTNMRVYMKGSEEVRSETTLADAEICAQMVTIIKGNTFYTGCVDGDIMPGCKWLQMNVEDSEQPPTSGTTAPPDYADVPPADINCVPWVYDASKFVVSGEVCNLDDLIKGYGDYQIPDD